MSAAQDALLLLALSPSLRIEPFLVLILLLPGSYARLPLSLVLKLLGLHKWLW